MRAHFNKMTKRERYAMLYKSMGGKTRIDLTKPQVEKLWSELRAVEPDDSYLTTTMLSVVTYRHKRMVFECLWQVPEKSEVPDAIVRVKRMVHPNQWTPPRGKKSTISG